MTTSLYDTLYACAAEISEAVDGHRGRGFSGERETQYHLDLAADAVAVRVLTGAGFRVVSEESGVNGYGNLTVVVDPIDGSTNCDHGIPFWSTSLAVVGNDELVAGLVMNHALASAYYAEAGQGATRDGETIAPSGQTDPTASIMAFSGLPTRHLGWAQNRALGSAALEFCLVADGALDVFGVAQHSTLANWDYMAGLLIAREAGAVVGDYHGEELVAADVIRRRPVVCATPELLQFMLDSGVL